MAEFLDGWSAPLQRRLRKNTSTIRLSDGMGTETTYLAGYVVDLGTARASVQSYSIGGFTEHWKRRRPAHECVISIKGTVRLPESITTRCPRPLEFADALKASRIEFRRFKINDDDDSRTLVSNTASGPAKPKMQQKLISKQVAKIVRIYGQSRSRCRDAVLNKPTPEGPDFSCPPLKSG